MAAIIGDAYGGGQRINDVPSAVLDRLEATPGLPPGSEQTAADQVIGCDTSKKPRPHSLPPV